jgi:hypothetical protein
MSSSPTPKELYQSCENRERDLYRKDRDIDRIRELLAKEVIFQPLFAIDSDAASADASAEQRRRAIDEAIWRGKKYRDLLELLAKCKGIEARWILLARWLRQEGICEPEDFLPKEMELESLTRKFWRGTRRQDFLHVACVEIWRPYFVGLLGDRDHLKEKGVRRYAQELEKLGYHSDAVDLALQESSPLEVIYSWLSSRNRGTIEAVRNAYSRFSGATKRLIPEEVRSVYGKEIEELERQGRPSGLLKHAVSFPKRNKA